MINSKDTKSSLKDVISGLLDAATKDNQGAYSSLRELSQIQEALNYASNADYERFDNALTFPISSVIDGLLESVTDNPSARFILKHWQYIDSHFCHLFEKLEGSAYSADKSKTLTSYLLQFYLTGEVVELNYEQQYTFHLPKKILKDHESITKYFKGLENLYYGSPDKYLSAINEMLISQS